MEDVVIGATGSERIGTDVALDTVVNADGTLAGVTPLREDRAAPARVRYGAGLGAARAFAVRDPSESGLPAASNPNEVDAIRGGVGPCSHPRSEWILTSLG